MLFTYKAKSKNGEILEGTMEAVDRFSLSHELKSKGNIPISIVEKKENSFDFASFWSQVFSKVKNCTN